jgi:hypothetical protein
MPERPRTLPELRALRRGALAILQEAHPEVAAYLAIVDESLTRLEDATPQPLVPGSAGASFRQATRELRDVSEAVTKPISQATQETLRRRSTPGYGFEIPPDLKKEPHDS